MTELAAPAETGSIRHRLGGVGVWASQLRSRDRAKIRDVAVGLEDLGFPTLWAPGGWAGDVLADMRASLDATSRVVLASGVLNIWLHRPDEVGEWYRTTTHDDPGRVLLGLGVSHPNRVADMGKTYRPMSAMCTYLDGLDAAGVPATERVLAALGPRMLELARERSAGVHTYTVDPTHTATARSALGSGAFIAPEIKVILAERRAGEETARAHVRHYLGLENYARNLLRNGYTEADLDDGGSDRLIHTLFAIGDVDDVRSRIAEHRAAGADHVCMQVIGAPRGEAPWAEWTRLAEGISDLLPGREEP